MNHIQDISDGQATGFKVRDSWRKGGIDGVDVDGDVDETALWQRSVKPFP
jgi:hypothetical protein